MNPNQNQNPLDPQTPPVVPPNPVPPAVGSIGDMPPTLPTNAPITPTPINPLEQSPVAGQPQPAVPQNLPPMSLWTKIKLILVLIVLTVAGVFLFQQNAKDQSLKNDGVKTEGISDGKYRETKTGGKNVRTVYKAHYEYSTAEGYKSSTYGEKHYSSPDDIKAGMKATVYYDPNDPGKGAYVEDEE